MPFLNEEKSFKFYHSPCLHAALQFFMSMSPERLVTCTEMFSSSVACSRKSSAQERYHWALGPVVWRPISANAGVNLNPSFFIPLFKSLLETNFHILIRTSSDQIASKKIWTAFSFKAFRPEIKFQTNLGLSKLSFEKLRPGVLQRLECIMSSYTELLSSQPSKTVKFCSLKLVKSQACKGNASAKVWTPDFFPQIWCLWTNFKIIKAKKFILFYVARLTESCLKASKLHTKFSPNLLQITEGWMNDNFFAFLVEDTPEGHPGVRGKRCKWEDHH